MAGKKIADYTVGIGFQVDPKGLQQALNNLKNLDIEKFRQIHIDLDPTEAQTKLNSLHQTVYEVQKALNQSYNVKLNTYDLEKFTSICKVQFPQIIKDFNEMGASGQQAMLAMNKAFTSTNIELKQTYSWLDKIGQTFANTIRWQVATKAIQAVTGSIQSAVYFTKDLDKSLNDIRIVTNKSAESMDKFAQKAIIAAKELGKTTTDYTNASLIFYQQGLADEEVAARTETTLKASNITGQSASSVSEQLTAVWNGYQVGIEDTEKAIDKLAAVAATSAADLEELSTAMSKVAATANMTGVDIDQLNAQISTIISVTRQAPETVGTALKTIYARISDLKLGGKDEDGLGLGDVSGKLHDIGIEVLNSTGDLRDMGTVIEEIAEKWNYLSRAERTALAEVMGGKRQYTNLVALFDNWDKYNKALETSRNSLGTLQEQQDTYMDSIKAIQNQVTAAKEGLYATIMDSDTIYDINKGLVSILDKITKIMKTLGGGKGLLNSITGILAMALKNPLANTFTTAFNNFNARSDNKKALEYISKNSKILEEEYAKAGMTKDNSSVAAYNSRIGKYTKQFENQQITLEQYRSLTQAAEEYALAQIKVQQQDELNMRAKQKYNELLGEELKYTTEQDKADAKLKVTEAIKESAKAIQDATIKLENFKSAQENLLEKPGRVPRSPFNQIKKDLDAAGISFEKAKINVDNLMNRLKNTEDVAKQHILAESIDKINGYNEALRKHTEAKEAYNQQQEVLNIDIDAVNNTLQKQENIKNDLMNLDEALGNVEVIAEQKAEEATKEHNLAIQEQNALRQKQAQDLSKFITGTTSALSAIGQLTNGINSLTSGEADTIGLFVTFGMSIPMLVRGLTNMATGIHSVGLMAKEAFGSALIGIAPMIAGIAAAGTALALLNEKFKQAKKAREAYAESMQQEFDKANQSAEASKQEADNVEELSKAYNDLKVSFKEQNKTSKELEKATYDLLEQYGYEQTAIDVLIGKYNSYEEAVKGVTKAKEQEAKSDAEQQKHSAINSIAAEIASNQLQKNFAEGITKRGLSDTQQDSFANILGLTLEEFREADAGTIAELIADNYEQVQKFYINQLTATGTDSKFTTAVKGVLDSTSEEITAINTANDTLKQIEANTRMRDTFGSNKEEFDNRDLAGIASAYANLSSEQQQVADTYISNNIGGRELQNIKLVNLGYTVEEVKNMSDELALTNLSMHEQYENLSEDSINALKKLKLASAEYQTALDDLAVAQEAIFSFDTSKGFNEDSLKEIFDTKQLEHFSNYLEQSGYTLEEFLNRFSQNQQIDTLGGFYNNLIDLANNANDIIKNTNNEIDKLTTEKTEEIIAAQNNLKKSTTETREAIDKELEEHFYNQEIALQEITDKYEIFWKIADEGATTAGTWIKDAEKVEEVNKILQDRFAIVRILTDDYEKLSEVEKIVYDYFKEEYGLSSTIETYKKEQEDYNEIIQDATDTIKAYEKGTVLAEEVVEAFNTILGIQSYLFKTANQEVDNIQSAYNTLSNAVDTYNENGYVTIDQMQELVTMDAQYLKYLSAEGNQLSVDTDNMNALTKAKIDMMRQQIINTAYTALEALEQKELNNVVTDNIYANILDAESHEQLSEAMNHTKNEVLALKAAMSDRDDLTQEKAQKIIDDMNTRLAVLEKTSYDLTKQGNKEKEKSNSLVEAELNIYHDINIELGKIERELDRINKKREKLLGKDLYNTYNEELATLEAQEDALKRLQDLQKQDAADKRARLEANGVKFDANGEVSNYNAIKQKWADQVNASGGDEVLSKRRDELEELLSGYEELWDEKIPNTVDKLTDVANSKIEAAVNKFNLHIDVTLDLTEMKRAFNEFKRDFIDKIRDDDYSKYIETLTENMKVSYQAMQENLGHVQAIQAEINKIRDGQTSDIYGDDLARAIEDLENYNSQLQKEMETVTEDLIEANEKYAESIDKLTEAYAKQQEYLDKLTKNYENNAKLLQLLYGENRASGSIADLLNKQVNVLTLSAHKYRAEAAKYEAEIAEIQKQLASDSLTEETRKALEEELQTLQDASLEAIENAGAASVAAIEKSKEALEASVRDNVYQMATNLLGQDLDTFKADWEATQHYAELYYDEINRAFETQKLMNKYQKSLNELTGPAQKNLQKAYEAEMKYLKEKDNLTKYDVERAQKKYELLVAQIQLEEAQQNKNTLQLTRDSQGNYRYMYTADTSAISEAEEKVANVQQELYNLDLEEWKENTNKILEEIDTVIEKVTESFNRQNEKIKEVEDNTKLSEDEKKKKIQEITDEETGIREKYWDTYQSLTDERLAIALNAEESTTDSINSLNDGVLEHLKEKGIDYNTDLETELMPKLFTNWETTNKQIKDANDTLTTDLITNDGKIKTSSDEVKDKSDLLTGAIKANDKSFRKQAVATQEAIEAQNNTTTAKIKLNSETAKTAYDSVNDKLIDELIPATDDYITKLSDEVDETKDAADKAEELAKAYKKMYTNAANTIEAVNALVEACKAFDELEDSEVTHTVTTEYKVVGEPTADTGMDTSGAGTETTTPTVVEEPKVAEEPKKGQEYTVVRLYSDSQLQTEKDKKRRFKEGAEYTYHNGAWMIKDLAEDYTAYIEESTFKALLEAYYAPNNLSKKTIDNIASSGPARDAMISARNSAIEDVLKKHKTVYFDTGGYTGSWGDSGRLGVLHQKELVLNQMDTANLLETIKYQRQITQMQMAAAATMPNTPSSITSNNQLDQNVHITANFPNAQNHTEIEEALINLTNYAAQKANSNLL